jgi:hypothetical protein
MVAEKGRPAREKQGGCRRRVRARQLPQPVHDPATPVLEAAAGVGIHAAEKGAADAAGDDVVPGGASRETRDGRGSVMRGLLPWNRVTEEVSAVAVTKQSGCPWQ